MDTNLVNAAVGLSQAKLFGQVQVLVAKKILDSETEDGSAAVNLLQSATTGMDKAASAMVAATTGLGTQLDVSA